MHSFRKRKRENVNYKKRKMFVFINSSDEYKFISQIE